jgi:hypothetical protein
MEAVLPQHLVPVVAAVIAGAVAFLASVLTKELKTSEFRQAWIDALRNDLADLASLALMNDDLIAHKVRSAATEREISDYIAANAEAFTKIMACAMRIEMRLNPREHETLLSIVRQVGTSRKTFRGNTDESAAAADRLLAESQRVLKREWQRVKRGENVFHYTKWASFWLVAAGLVAVLVAILKQAGASAA